MPSCSSQPLPKSLSSACCSTGELSWLLRKAVVCHLLQVLGMLAILGLGSVTLTLFLWQGPTSFTSPQMFPEEVPSWFWETLKGDTEQNNSCQ